MSVLNISIILKKLLPEGNLIKESLDVFVRFCQSNRMIAG